MCFTDDVMYMRLTHTMKITYLLTYCIIHYQQLYCVSHIMSPMFSSVRVT